MSADEYLELVKHKNDVVYLMISGDISHDFEAFWKYMGFGNIANINSDEIDDLTITLITRDFLIFRAGMRHERDSTTRTFTWRDNNNLVVVRAKDVDDAMRLIKESDKSWLVSFIDIKDVRELDDNEIQFVFGGD